MADYHIKRGDRLPSMVVTFTGGSGRTLSGATVVCVLKKLDGTVLLRANATIEDATARRVRYDFASGDSDTDGDRFVEWEVTYGDGLVETFPVDSYQVLRVRPDLR